MLANAFSQLLSIAVAIVGCLLPLILSGLIPNGFQRWAGAISCLIGSAFLLGIAHFGSSYFNVGMGIGFVLAAIKLVAGIRFL